MYLSTTDQGQVKFVFEQIDLIEQQLHVKLSTYEAPQTMKNKISALTQI